MLRSNSPRNNQARVDQEGYAPILWAYPSFNTKMIYVIMPQKTFTNKALNYPMVIWYYRSNIILRVSTLLAVCNL